MKRRNFIISSTIIGAASFLTKQVFAYGVENKPVVWEVEGEVSAAVSKIFEELGGISALLPKGVGNSTVILKPNLCLADSDSKATTTSSSLVGAICSYLVKQGVKRIIVTDHTLQGGDLFANQPIVTEAQKYPEVKVILANEQRYFVPSEVKGKVLTSLETLKLIQKADLLINLPTAKHHTATQVSLGIKNLMGLIWDRSAFHTELDLNQAIGDLAMAIKPDFTIVDATRVLLKGGPTGPGPVVKDNRYFVSRDIVAVDSVVTSKYTFGGKSLSAINVAHIKAAYENGVGEIDINKIELKKINA